MLSESKERARWGATVAVFSTHGVLAILALVNRLAYSVPPAYEFLAITATNPIWVVLHGGVFLFGLWGLRYRRDAMFETVSVSAGVLGAWALINMLWGLNPVRPVSLAGPVLATGMSLVAYFLARLWLPAAGGDHRKREP